MSAHMHAIQWLRVGLDGQKPSEAEACNEMKNGVCIMQEWNDNQHV